MRTNWSELTNDELLKDLKTSKESLEELNKRIEKKLFKFNDLNIDSIYLYLYACNKFEDLKVLRKLIDDNSFLKLLEQSELTGSMIVSLTNVFQNYRSGILSLDKIKKSIINGDDLLNSEDVLDDLTKEEILELRKDIEIDNYLIANGLRFDALTESTKLKLLSDYKLLTVYNNRVIQEFTNSLANQLPNLANDEEYLNIYIKSLEDNYVREDKIFKYLSVDGLNYILSTKPSFEVVYHLVRSTEGDTKEELLKNPKVIELLSVCKDSYVLETLPSNIKETILEGRKNLLEGVNAEVLYSLPKKEIAKLFEIQLYDEFIEALKDDRDINIELLVHSLPTKLLKDLSENQLINFNNRVVNELLKINPVLFRKNILANKEVCLHIAGLVPKKDNTGLKDIFKNGEFTPSDQTTFINNCETIKSGDALISLIRAVSNNYRKDIYENKTIMDKVISSKNFELDEYTVQFLQNNHNAVLELNPEVLVELLNTVDLGEATKLLDDDKVLDKLFKEHKDDIAGLINSINKKELIPYFTKDSLMKYYSKDNLQIILDALSLPEKKAMFVNKLQELIFKHDEELIKLYKALENKNTYVINTLYLNFFNPSIKGIKLNLLEKITKSRELQEILFDISKKAPFEINSLITVLNICNELTMEQIIDMAKVYRDSALGVNRKKYGNLPKIINIIDKKSLNNHNLKLLLSYVLYLVPRYYAHKEIVPRPIVVNTPNTFNDILTYEFRVEEVTSLNILKGKDILENFVIRHFKMTTKEASILLDRYNLNKIDTSVYKKECEFITNLNKIMNTDEESLKALDETYKVYSMFDSFAIENSIKEMYGKIYNFEIKTRSNINKYKIEKLYGKEVKINECNNEFMFLLSELDYSEEFTKYNSYLEAWHVSLAKDTNDLKTTFVSNDNIKPFDDFYFGFNGVLDTGIIKMSKYDICNECMCSSKIEYLHPYEMIDNTRDKNTLYLDKYAIRPNYNNSNRPFIEPDFILINLNRISDHTYLETVIRASQEFKTKRNKDGLPIFGIDFDQLVKNEKNKLDKMIERYNKSKDMVTLHNILTRLENNYSNYIDTPYAKTFDINIFLDILKKRIPQSNSVAELEYLLDSLKEEDNKYQENSNIDIKKIEELIKKRIIEINS